MTDKGIKVSFTKEQSNIIMKDGTVFNMKKQGKLYFVKAVATSKEKQETKRKKQSTY